jgi:hypothetical protein
MENSSAELPWRWGRAPSAPPVRLTRWVDSAPPVALLSASSRMVVGARPMTSASAELLSRFSR